MLSKGKLQSAFRALLRGIGATCVVLRPLLVLFGGLMIAALTVAGIIVAAIIAAPFKHRD